MRSSGILAEAVATAQRTLESAFPNGLEQTFEQMRQAEWLMAQQRPILEHAVAQASSVIDSLKASGTFDKLARFAEQYEQVRPLLEQALRTREDLDRQQTMEWAFMGACCNRPLPHDSLQLQESGRDLDERVERIIEEKLRELLPHPNEEPGESRRRIGFN